MKYILIISLIFIIVGLLLLITDAFFLNDKEKKLKKRSYHNFCILIPARYESKVINNIIDSIKKQSIKVDLSSVYVIVEDKSDPTINICKENNINYFIREKLELKSKGYALMEVIEDLYKNNKHYDLYFIFEADNVLDSNYLSSMLEYYNMGYDVVTGYRKSSNINTNSVSSSSALTFSLINDLLNQNKVARNRSITISGTGYFISSEIIDKFKSFPFHLMTEDYELSMYLAMNDYGTYYNREAIFYDEQPTSFITSVKQRIRWCYGYLQVRRKYRKELKRNLNTKTAIGEYIGIKPYVSLLIGIFFFYIYLVTGLFIDFNRYIKVIIFTTLLIYTLLVIFTYFIILIDKDLGLNNKLKVKTLLYNPLYLFSYLYCMIRAMFGNISWERIEHTGIK